MQVGNQVVQLLNLLVYLDDHDQSLLNIVDSVDHFLVFVFIENLLSQIEVHILEARHIHVHKALLELAAFHSLNVLNQKLLYLYLVEMLLVAEILDQLYDLNLEVFNGDPKHLFNSLVLEGVLVVQLAL